MDGVSGVLALLGEQVGAHPVAFGDPLVCSSAGGGLRLAVVGYELVVTAEAARRAAVSAGGRVVHLAHGVLDPDEVAALRAARPDVVVLTGGTDGGDGDVLLANAAALAPALAAARGRPGRPRRQRRRRRAGRGPAARGRGRRHPHRQRAAPDRPARAAARPRGGAGRVPAPRHRRGPAVAAGAGSTVWSSPPRPTPSSPGSRPLAAAFRGGVLAVDVGGATTDVYSVLSQPSADSVEADVAGLEVASRTVEGDLGMRWSAPGVAAAAARGGPRRPAAAGPAGPASPREAAWPRTPAPAGGDAPSPRHRAGRGRRGDAPSAGTPARAGPGAPPRPLRDVELVVGSGGVLRHGDAARAERVLGAVCADHAGMWHVPDAAATAVDAGYVLCALGLLALAEGSTTT